MKITDFIPVGRDNAIARKTLVALTGLSDRRLREMIEAARLSGEVICNLQQGDGYFRPDDPADMEIQYKLNLARIRSLSMQNRAIKNKMRRDVSV